jgi:hypothetical protein
MNIGQDICEVQTGLQFDTGSWPDRFLQDETNKLFHPHKISDTNKEGKKWR